MSPSVAPLLSDMCTHAATLNAPLIPIFSRAQEIPSNNFLDTFLTNDLVAIHVQVKNRGWNIIQGIFLLNEK